MPRRMEPFSVIKRPGSPYWYYKLGPWKDIHGYTVFLTAATTGMRRGEILALTWEHVHFKEGFIEVEQAWKDRHEMGLPKWNKKRIVPLPSQLAETLHQIKRKSKHTQPQDMGDKTRFFLVPAEFKAN